MALTNQYDLCHTAVYEIVQGITFAGLTSVVRQKRMELVNQSFPCVLVTIDENRIEPTGRGTNLSDDLAFPINVLIIDIPGVLITNTDGADKYETWKAQIISALHHKRPAQLNAITGYLNCEVAPRAMYDPSLPDYEKVKSSLLVRPELRVAR